MLRQQRRIRLQMRWSRPLLSILGSRWWPGIRRIFTPLTAWPPQPIGVN